MGIIPAYLTGMNSTLNGLINPVVSWPIMINADAANPRAVRNMKDLEARIQAIEVRNQRVQMDKKWETSWTRRLSIAGLTYIVVFIYLEITGNDNSFINAFVPPVGFILSTLLMKPIRNIWQQNKS